ncbi:multicopper oxidase family protein [Marinibaculum pumilum]|uniref:Multicopper oxidase family protein n=1 Tax=Marinibaculum pumilum TaxID=1766165 RepID=A0ABV7LA86_9PROT
MTKKAAPTRRAFLAATGLAAVGGLALPAILRPAVAAPEQTLSLRPAPGTAPLVGAPYEPTPVWCFNDSLPGPEIRLRQGQRVRIAVENGLAEETGIHWHGLRVPNAMDGVPHLTQKPIAPGGQFSYEFEVPDAGTFWYHPHQRSSEQVGRGLYGPLIVEEREPPRVDRDLTWILDDWRLTEKAQISDDFGNLHDASHAGRFGNILTVNGRQPQPLEARGGERIRLRLINAANARIFGLDFAGHRPQIIALDGQPVPPHAPPEGVVVVGPGMRTDLILDMTGAAGSRHQVTDRYYPRQTYQVTEIAYADRPLRDNAPDWSLALPPNPLAEPDLDAATRHEVVFNGGMMGGRMMQEMGGPMASMPMARMQRMMQDGRMWFVNGIAADGHAMAPVLTLERGRTYIIAMANATAFPHPMHLHGHAFRVISRDGAPTPHREWRDTVLMTPGERVEIALVADNPGDWMFHCHILEHQAAGMSAVVRVA